MIIKTFYQSVKLSNHFRNNHNTVTLFQLVLRQKNVWLCPHQPRQLFSSLVKSVFKTKRFYKKKRSYADDFD